MGMLLCEQNFRDVWSRNESVRAEIGQILRARTHTHTHAAKLVVEIAFVLSLTQFVFSILVCDVEHPYFHPFFLMEFHTERFFYYLVWRFGLMVRVWVRVRVRVKS